ncbi:MAG: 3-oxoacyl-ACP synthase [Bacteroidetes bacterium]|nr:3-oxoacyl-ACP synthase [Bacteroidota bacterium]
MKISISIKRKLLDECREYIEQRIHIARKAMNEAQDAANTELKSSAGDKYETSRAMMLIERENHAIQLSEALQVKKVLEQIRIDKKLNQVQTGSLVVTTYGNFFVAIGAGKIVIGKNEFFAVSHSSPIGMKLQKLHKGDAVEINGKNVKILAII